MSEDEGDDDDNNNNGQWTDAAIDTQLTNLYYAAGDPAGFGGVERLYQRAVDIGIPVDRARVRRFLTEQHTYQLHKPVLHKFKRNQTLVAAIDEQWQADLADMQDLAKDNNGTRYILTCIDVLSRYAWAIPTRSKNAPDMLAAMKRLFAMAAPRKPKRLQTDKGREFHNVQVRKFLQQNGVELFSTQSDHKAAVVERFNRTLKSRLYKHLTANNTKRYVDVLGDIVYSYNHSYHRTIGRRPVDVDTQEVGDEVWKRVYYDSKEAKLRRADAYPTNTDNVAAEGDRVRMSRWKKEFEKGYLPNWTREQFRVTDVNLPRRGGKPRPVYKLEDTGGEELLGWVYPEELQYVPDKIREVLEVDRVLRKRKGANNQQESLVKFKGYPDKFNRWITDAELHKYQQTPREQQQ